MMIMHHWIIQTCYHLVKHATIWSNMLPAGFHMCHSVHSAARMFFTCHGIQERRRVLPAFISFFGYKLDLFICPCYTYVHFVFSGKAWRWNWVWQQHSTWSAVRIYVRQWTSDQRMGPRSTWVQPTYVCFSHALPFSLRESIISCGGTNTSCHESKVSKSHLVGHFGPSAIFSDL